MTRFRHDTRRTQLIATGTVAFFTLASSLFQLSSPQPLDLLAALDLTGALSLGVVSLVALALSWSGRTAAAGNAFFVCAIMGCCSGVLVSASPSVFVLNACGLCALSIFPPLVLDERSIERPWGVLMAVVWFACSLARVLWRGPGFEADTRDAFLLVLGPPVIISVSWFFSQSLRRRITRAVDEAEEGRRALALSNEKLERSRSRALRALERARAAADARSTLVANASHELRTPLTSILGYSGLVLEDLEALSDPDAPGDVTPAEILADVRLIDEHARQLLDLINDVLDLSKLEVGKRPVSFESFPLDPLLDELCSTTRPLATRRGNTVDLRNTSHGIHLNTDRGVLRQIMVNLLSNAAKFTDSGVVTLHAYPHDMAGFCLAVQDTGVGISEGDLSTIFDPFTQLSTSPVQRGTGLGLALVSELCASINAEIQVHSTLGVGSTFTVVLPPRAVAGLPSDAIPSHDP
jgi:signal transduction histidine kinase